MTTVKIRRKGTITIPAKLRKEYKLYQGQTLTIIDLGKGTILLTPKVPRWINWLIKSLRNLRMKASLSRICYGN